MNRDRLRELLADEGFGEAEQAAAALDGRLELLPLQRVLTHAGTLTVDEVAARAGLEPEQLRAAQRALGLPVDSPEAVYGDDLVERARTLAAVLDAGVPLEAVVRFNLVVGRAMTSIAAGGRDLILELLEHSEAEPAAYPLAAAGAAELFIPRLQQILESAIVEHLRELVDRESDGLFDDNAVVRSSSVAFVDVVGSTGIGDVPDPRSSAELAATLEQATVDSLAPGVALVKVIGDEVMLVSQRSEPLVDSVLGLLGRAARTRELPPLRAGAAHGQLVGRAGDWYGRPAIVASRLTERAEPGSLLCQLPPIDAAPSDDDRWAGPFELELRGMATPVRAWSIRAAA